jgi:uncharacterized protein YcaQ
MSAPARRLGREEARRIAVRAQLLDADRPSDLATVVDRLTFVQLDPTASIAPTADLVLWSRLGDAYEPANLQRAVEVDRMLFETDSQPTRVEPAVAMLRPTADLGLWLSDMAARPRYEGSRRWFEANDGFRRRILDQLRDSGPLTSRDFKDSSDAAWQSAGWTNDRNVSQMLGMLLARGEIAVAARQGRQRLYDVADRVFPAGVAPIPAVEAQRIRDDRWLRSVGIARPKFVGDAGIMIEVEGTKGVWRLDPEASAEGFEGRTALLSPFDRLSHDRVRAIDLFEFEYVFEAYKPASKRRWGFYALPILHGDRLVGKVDATADRDAGVLRVDAIHEDVAFDSQVGAAVLAEIEALATWLGLSRARFS